jgi:uncharacterized membrane protein YphA (DoxX/SURF4 family)
LLLLRAAVGVTSVVQGGFYFAQSGNSTLETSVIGLLAILGGASILIGFLTPVVASLVGLVVIGIGCSWFPPVARNLFDAALPTVLLVTIAAAVVFLGPGALSIDARLFGRRQIIIPQVSRLQKP